MSQQYKEKLQDLESYTTTLEEGVKKATIVNVVIYGIIILLFLFYAIYIPAEVKKYASAEEGPGTLVHFIDGALPSNTELLSGAQEKIPRLIDESIAQMWSYMPNAEQMLLEVMSGMTDELVGLIRDDSAPVFKEFLIVKIQELKAVTPDLSNPAERKKFNRAAFVCTNIFNRYDDRCKNKGFTR